MTRRGLFKTLFGGAAGALAGMLGWRKVKQRPEWAWYSTEFRMAFLPKDPENLVCVFHVRGSKGISITDAEMDFIMTGNKKLLGNWPI